MRRSCVELATLRTSIARMTESDSSARHDFDIFKALALVLTFTAWNATSDVIYDQLQLDSYDRTAPLRLALILLGTLVTCGGVAWLGCVVWAKHSFASLGWRAPRPLRLVSLGLLLAAVLFAGVFGIVALLGGVREVRGFAAAIATMPASDRVFFALMGAKVAFAEETLFRGLLLSSLRRWMGALAAVVLSSVVFGLYHRAFVPVPLLLMKMVLGTLLGVFTLTSRSLVPSWIGHSLLWAIAGDN
jgi:membrane protease YdiL (CAAX protease family)